MAPELTQRCDGDVMTTRRPIEPEPPRVNRLQEVLNRLDPSVFEPEPTKVKSPEPMDNQVELSIEIIMGIEKWFAIQVRELKDGDEAHDDGYGFDKFLMVLNRRCPGVLRAILDAGAANYV